MRHANGTFASKSDALYVIEFRGYKTPCYIWQKGVSGVGYGMHRENRNSFPKGAHVWMYEMANGKVPRGLELDHLCRNRLCVRPDHLEAVTHKVNARRGAKTKLNDDQVRSIRLARLMGLPVDAIANWYDCHEAHISRICSGKRGAI